MNSLGKYAGMIAEEAIAAAAAECSNHGKWGTDDQRGCVNYITPEKVREAAGLVRRGAVFSLALPFDHKGPQSGGGRFNPIHLMSFTGADYLAADRKWRAPHGFGGTDDIVIMPLQCGTQWDALSHIFDHGLMWNGFSCGEVNSRGARKCGIEHAAGGMVTRGVLLDVPRAKGVDRLADGHAITEADLEETIEAQGPTSAVRTGDVVIVRTGHLGDCLKRNSWEGYAGGDAPGLSFSTLPWLHRSEIAGVATDTWGAEVRPLEFPNSYQPFHQVAIPHIGLMLGEIWTLDALAEDCAADGVYEFQLAAQPLPFTGAVGSPVNPMAIK